MEGGRIPEEDGHGGGIGHHTGTDEVVEEVMGRGSCVATVTDYDTRFCLAVQVSPTKDGQNSADLFRAAREMAGRDPLVTRSDSLEAIGSGYEEVFGRNTCSILVRDAHMRNQGAHQQPSRAVQLHPARTVPRPEGPPDRNLHDGRMAVLQLPPPPHGPGRDHAGREGGDVHIRPRQDDHADTERGNVRNGTAAAAMDKKREGGLHGGLMRHGPETGLVRPPGPVTAPIAVPARAPARACAVKTPKQAVGPRRLVRKCTGTGAVAHRHHALMQKNRPRMLSYVLDRRLKQPESHTHTWLGGKPGT